MYCCVLFPLSEVEKVRRTRPDELSVYVRRWRPSEYMLDDAIEVAVHNDSVHDLVTKVVRFTLLELFGFVTDTVYVLYSTYM